MQKTLLKLFCGIITRYKNIEDILADIKSTDKERVGNQNKATINSNKKDKRTI